MSHPFSFKRYSDLYPNRFAEVKKKIQVLSPYKLEIEHIGSTAVEGLGGKGIIDVSVGIKRWGELPELLKVLKRLGFRHFHTMENHSLFVSTRSVCREGEYHIHISRVGTKRYLRTIWFRDFLRNNLAETKRYERVKKEIFKKCKGDRKLYKELKNKYFFNLQY